MRKLILVNLIDYVPVPNQEFEAKEWPLHLTLVPPFSFDGNVETLIANIHEISRRLHLTTIQPAAPSDLGSASKPIPVIEIKPNPAVFELHLEFLEAVTSLGGFFERPEHTGHGYRPHVTVSHLEWKPMPEGHIVDAVTLVDMAPDGDRAQRRIIENFPLGS